MKINQDGIEAQLKRGAHKCWQKYSHHTRAMHAASHRLGHRQRERTGEHFWVHDLIPNISFPTRKAAIEAARRVAAEQKEAR